MKQYPNKSNETYLTRFRLMVDPLKLAGGKHLLVSDSLLGTNIQDATKIEIKEEKEKFMAI